MDPTTLPHEQALLYTRFAFFHDHGRHWARSKEYKRFRTDPSRRRIDSEEAISMKLSRRAVHEHVAWSRRSHFKCTSERCRSLSLCLMVLNSPTKTPIQRRST